MGLSLTAASLGRRSWPPYPSTDTKLLVDLDLTNGGAGFTSTSFAAAYPVFTVNNGGSAQWSPTLGFNPGNASNNCFIKPANDGSTPQSNYACAEGTIYLRIRRADVTYDQSTTATFVDSVGKTGLSGGATAPFLFGVNLSGTHRISLATPNPLGGGIDLDVRNNSTDSSTELSAVLVNSRLPNLTDGFDQDWLDIVIIWNRTEIAGYIDNHLAWCVPITAGVPFPATGLFGSIYIGCAFGNGTNFGSGSIWFKRLQIINRYSGPILAGPRIAIYGDSQAQNGDGATVDNDTLATWIGAVLGLSLKSSLHTNSGSYNSGFGQSRWINILQGMCWKNFGFYFPYVNASRSGKGYSINNGSGSIVWTLPTPGTQGGSTAGSGLASWAIPQSYQDGVNWFQPEILIAMTSVNDVSNSATASALVTDIKSRLDYMVDGNPNLRAILMIEAPSWETGLAMSGSINNPGWVTVYNAHVSAKRSAFLTTTYNAGTGLRATRYPTRVIPTTVPVTYIATREAWQAEQARTNGALQIMSNPLNTTSSRAAGAAPDGHCAPSGHAMIAQLLWPYLRDILSSRPVTAFR